MARACCIEGCSTAIEGTFFKFPNSRTLRRKWMDAITTKPNTKKVIEDSLICSIHFLKDEYEVIRGKTRLKAKVVPSLFVKPKSKSPDPSPTKLHKSDDNAHSTKTRTIESADSNKCIPTKPPDKDSNAMDTTNDETTRSDEFQKSLEPTAIKEISSNVEKNQRIQDHSDLEIKDIEDIITNYHIKQTIPNKIHSPENIDEPSNPSQNMNNGSIIEINDEHAEPQFIEISADKGQNGQPDGQDCLMVLENVQVEIDPNLMFPDYDDDIDENSNDSDVIDLGEKKNDPISLLTSSDEDEVIIEEPKIDTVEVSDDTDDDDVPLVKLLKTRKCKESSKKNRKSLNMQQVMWGGYEYYCVQCHFTTHSWSEYRKHKSSHSTVFEVCQLCDYTTASKSQFVRHKRKHKFEKRYQCHLCDYKAKHRMSLLYHLKTHTAVGIELEKCFSPSDKGDCVERLKQKQKHYKCDECKYKTLRRSDLKRHKRKIHQDYDDDQDVDYTPG
ncbi:zinc-responsive transcriptional regulator ZAP1-like [Aricia agestis]|uniref:zinc-responsive transcriptional regulator ZAP1-like n=1 Tax=Aricia agestis TaxID=91739 RepID=UPI001C2015CA|nr:zinc-responsive transcriptional regulator ZAP1-like [Aricia agestis]